MRATFKHKMNHTVVKFELESDAVDACELQYQIWNHTHNQIWHVANATNQATKMNAM